MISFCSDLVIGSIILMCPCVFQSQYPVTWELSWCSRLYTYWKPRFVFCPLDLSWHNQHVTSKLGFWIWIYRCNLKSWTQSVLYCVFGHGRLSIIVAWICIAELFIHFTPSFPFRFYSSASLMDRPIYFDFG